jgi:ketosteroid isomerase-like protein
MSRQNVETARTVIERFNREGGLPEELFDPDTEFSNLAESPLPGPYHGYEGLRQWRRDLFEVVEDGHFETWDFTDVDDADAVMFRMRLRGRTRFSGIEIDISWTTVNWFRDGRIHRSAAYTDRADALEAAGLSE